MAPVRVTMAPTDAVFGQSLERYGVAFKYVNFLENSVYLWSPSREVSFSGGLLAGCIQPAWRQLG